MLVRLTDQALVAVGLARALSAERPVTVAHLLAGLAAEPDGAAGRRLRERGSAAAVLAERARTAPAPALDTGLGAAAGLAGGRPVGTVHLLDAAVGVGGEDVADLLVSAGYARDLDGWQQPDPLEIAWLDEGETFGWHPEPPGPLDADAALLAARVRAVAGGAVEVLLVASVLPQSPLGDLEDTALAMARDQVTRESPDLDAAGLDVVLDAAATLRGGDRVRVRDIVAASLVAGGALPRRILERAEALWST